MNFLEIYLAVLITILGLCIGSFINVVAYRTVNHLDFIHGRSECPKCHTRLGVLDLIPLFSYAFLGGKCRYCKCRISVRYFIVEFVCGLLFLGAFLVFGLSYSLIVALVLMCILMIICLIDIDIMEIPDVLNVLIFLLGCIDFIINKNINFTSRVIGVFVVALPMFILNWFVKDSFGGGDIKLFGALGFLLGYKLIVLTGFIAILLAGLYAIYLIITKKVDSKSHIPFGPYICVGAVITYFWGMNILTWYFGLYI
ncbi:MAG: prepilin peptidase [Erysipelotrichaceae bacterium]